MITDSAIKKALRDAPTSGKKSIELSDKGPRGAGRLKLVIRITESKIIAEWYAVFWRDGKPIRAKIGTYPITSLRDARQDFAVRCRPLIVRGARPQGLQGRMAACTGSDPQGANGDVQLRPLRKEERRAREHALAISIARIEGRDPALSSCDLDTDDLKRAEAIINDLERDDYHVVRVRSNDRAID